MKKLAIIGGLIFSLGVIIFTSTLAACGWDLTKISTAPIDEEKQYSIANSNQTITLHDDNMPLIVGASSDDQIHLIYYENDNQYYEFNGSTDLTIEKKTQFKWYNCFFNIDFQTPCFSILLPSNFNGSLVLETSNGKITVDDVTMKQLKLTTSNAKISLKNLTSSEAVEVKSSNGRIEIQDLNSGGDISLTTNNNKIIGNIVGDMSDYSILSKTSNAKNNLPEYSAGGSKHLAATTSNGEIFIQFTN